MNDRFSVFVSAATLLLAVALPGCSPVQNTFAPLVGEWTAGPGDGGYVGGAQATPPDRVFRGVELTLRSDQSYTVDWAVGEMGLREQGQWSVDRLDRVLYLSRDRVTGGSAVYTIEGKSLVLESRRDLPWGRLRVRLTRDGSR